SPPGLTTSAFIAAITRGRGFLHPASPVRLQDRPRTGTVLIPLDRIGRERIRIGRDRPPRLRMVPTIGWIRCLSARRLRRLRRPARALAILTTLRIRPRRTRWPSWCYPRRPQAGGPPAIGRPSILPCRRTDLAPRRGPRP